MISTKIPYGAIAEKEVAFLKEPYQNRFYMVDIHCNRFEIEESVYVKLKNSGLTVRR